MIISASYRTDIPMFYSEWFLNRLNAGFCMSINPYNDRPYRVDLTRESVDAFVFWTKNIIPFLDNLTRLKERSFPFVIQYTINNYSEKFEGRSIGLDKLIASVKFLTKTYGIRSVVWRYDPIIISSITDAKWHFANFANIAGQLDGFVDEVTVSFMQFYPKVRKRIANADRITFCNPKVEDKIKIIDYLTNIARQNNITLTVCTQPYLKSSSIIPASCIDAKRISDVIGHPIKPRPGHNRPGCLCAKSIDIGCYDSCPYGCIYCYAVNDQNYSDINFKAHDPVSDFLCKGTCH